MTHRSTGEWTSRVILGAFLGAIFGVGMYVSGDGRSVVGGIVVGVVIALLVTLLVPPLRFFGLVREDSPEQRDGEPQP